VAETKSKAKAKAKATRPRQEDGSPAAASGEGTEATSENGYVCNVAFCPIGLALTAVQPIRPDVVEHLLVAGRELLMAAKALLDVRAEDLKTDSGSSTFERIDIA
jgi:hypothetical protein